MASAKPSTAQHRAIGVLSSITVILAVVWAFLPALRNGFVSYDDPDYVTRNPEVQRGVSWEAVRWAFCESRTSGNWHPVTMLSHMLDCQWSGMNPWGHHLTSVILHSVNALLVFVVLRLMTGATWRSLCVAAVFGLHPLRVESVAWISERKDVLSTLFLLLTLWAYARYAGTPTRAAGRQRALHYVLTLVFFAIGLMSKPMLVTLPCVMLLLDYWPLRRLDSTRLARLLLEKIPFFALSAASSAATFVVQKQGGAMDMAGDTTIAARLGNALIGYCRYLGKTFWPEDLAVFYPFPSAGWPPVALVLAGVLLTGITIIVVLAGKRHRFLPTGWFWFLGTLVPVIGIVQVGQQSMADRYTYIPSIGLLVAIIWTLAELRARLRLPFAAAAVATVTVLAVCAAGTRRQIAHWKDGEALFRHAHAVTESNGITELLLGIALLEKGSSKEANAAFQEAITVCRRALEFQSLNVHDKALAHGNLGSSLMGIGAKEEAIREFEAALRLLPGNRFIRVNLGRAYVSDGRLDAAVALFGDGIRMDPDNGREHFFLACVLSEKKQMDAALHHFREAARLEPHAVDAQRELAQALSQRGEIGAAILQWQRVLRLAPSDPAVHTLLGVNLAQDARFDEAISEFREALRLKPGDEDAQSNLEVAIAQKATGKKP